MGSAPGCQEIQHFREVPQEQRMYEPAFSDAKVRHVIPGVCCDTQVECAKRLSYSISIHQCSVEVPQNESRRLSSTEHYYGILQMRFKGESEAEQKTQGTS